MRREKGETETQEGRWESSTREGRQEIETVDGLVKGDGKQETECMPEKQ